MMNEHCKSRSYEQLIEFADGELATDEAARFQQHLDECASCRRELALLESSLNVASVLWEAAAGDVALPASAESDKGKQGRGSRAAAWTCAAALLAVAALGVYFSGLGPRSQGECAVSQAEASLSADTAASGTRAKLDANTTVANDAAEDIDALLASEARAARLAASAQLLSTMPSLAEYSKQAEQYLVANYAESNAVRVADGDLPIDDHPMQKRDP